MVILRSLSDGEEASSPPLLTPATGCISTVSSGVSFSTLLGFSTELSTSTESSESRSGDSDSGSDCVVISSFDFHVDPKVRVQKGLEVMEAHAFTSVFVTPESISMFRKGRLLGSGMDEAEIIVEAVADNKPITLVRPQGSTPTTFYMYISLFTHLGVLLPFTSFECEVLRFANVAPSQLHPNSWSFVRAFEILCSALEVEPSVPVFFSFYQIRGIEPDCDYLQVYRIVIK
ncbi:hypothetical protein A2U01_0020595 [Trifolium medium]|uniref:Transposase (putative) gypsy type domain-containing protein n=1 Tax=Trifolium medium TaxID=97028 RepID=A0A392NJI5_9FABA|nr:hypothetical protein [Trifolium medium]